MAHKPKRVGFVLDMTPLVDIAFLLLTFFMFTAKFKSQAESEQKFEIKRPVASADTSRLPEVGTAIIKIAIEDTGDTTTWYAVANEKARIPIYETLPRITPQVAQQRAQIDVMDTVELGYLIRATRAQDAKIKFMIDADRNVEYERIEKVMNTLRSQGATIFNFVTISSEG